MGKIRKTASLRHEITLSHFLADFIATGTDKPLQELQAHLTSFPITWPFPRGDLYHWIPLLNRFDSILEQFVKVYGLQDGPQICEFGTRVLLDTTASEEVKGKSTAEVDRTSDTDQDGDRELLEHILDFTAILFDQCGNRSLYASSGHLSKLLNTTSLSLLKSVLRLSWRLAKRYYASRQRYSSHQNPPVAALLQNHYQLDLDHLHEITAAFSETLITSHTSDLTSPSRTETSPQTQPTSGRSDASRLSGMDMVAVLRHASQDDAFVQQLGDAYSTSSIERIAGDQTEEEDVDGDETMAGYAEPSSPSIARSNSTSQRQARRARFGSNEDTPSKSRDKPEATIETATEGFSPESGVFAITTEMLQKTPTHEILKRWKECKSNESAQSMLNRLRIAKAMFGDKQSRTDIVAIRLLAIANAAYVDQEVQFQQKIGQQDSEQPRRHQLTSQLTEMLQTNEATRLVVDREMQIYALWTLEALLKQKQKAADVYNALSANVNHGTLFSVLREVVAQAGSDSTSEDLAEEQWKEAVFQLLLMLPGHISRAGESMLAAGLFDILVEILKMRTFQAERTHHRVLTFLDNFAHSIREALPVLGNAKGLDAIAELSAYTVELALTRVQQGEGMPSQYKTRMTDYAIPFHLQLTLRWIMKFMNHTMNYHAGNMNRQLRNLIESPQVLDSLRQIISNATIYGANVWSGAVNILSNYIHNEPTSYNVIAEAKLTEAFLNAVTGKSEGSSGGEKKSGILPLAEAILAIPTAFGALCLNENGAKLIEDAGAFSSFFSIFESPEHIKGLEFDAETASQLGSAFDELVRHQPTLKDSIISNVVEMVSKVNELCYRRAQNDGVGAKLYKAGADGKIYVAGGRQALTISCTPSVAKTSTQDASGDIEMGTEDASSSQVVSEVCVDDIMDKENAAKGPTATTFVSIVGRFISGFFSNKSSCQSFVEHGGLLSLIDLVTSPSLPCAFEDDLLYGDEISHQLQMCMEEKPHIALPYVLRRLEAAVAELDDFVDFQASTAFFEPFTRSNASVTDSEDRTVTITDKGTQYIKALSIVITLCNALAATFAGQTMTQRSQTNLFYQVNLADLYVKLVDRLGSLQSGCVWEEILIQKYVPKHWIDIFAAAQTVPDTEANRILGLATNNTQDTTSGSSNGSSAAPELARTASVAEGPALLTDSERESETARYRNWSALRSTLSQVPHCITAVFQNLARILLLRRVNDNYQKSNAVKVADQLAATVLQQLQCPRAQESKNKKDQTAFWVVALTTLNKLVFDDASTPHGVHANTLTLHSIAQQKGFEVLAAMIKTSFEQMNLGAVQDAQIKHDDQMDTTSIQGLVHAEMRYLLEFCLRVINPANIIEAPQTQTMSSRQSDRDKPDFFCGPQFLVELRTAVIKPALELWNSGMIEKASTPLVKVLVDIVQTELAAEHEAGAHTRSMKLPPRGKLLARKWKMRSNDLLNTLKEEFPEDLAREAVYRCYENRTTVRDYCTAFQKYPRLGRNPVPEDDVQPVDPAPPAPAEATVSDGEGDMPGFTSVGTTLDIPTNLLDILEGTNTGTQLDDAIPGLRRQMQLFDSMQEPEPAVSPQDATPVMTVDDLNEQREVLCKDLIDRCLDILNVHGELSFELAELLVASVPKTPSTDKVKTEAANAQRLEIGSTLLNSLASLQIEASEKAEFKTEVKKVSSYAHLLALIVQDESIYDQLRDELEGMFGALTAFIRPFPEERLRDASPWIGQILLIQEKLLSTDTSPKKVEFVAPKSKDPIVDYPVARLAQSFISEEDKINLFQALLEVMHPVGKSESLALSITRVLVNLTRTRKIALLLAKRQNMDRLLKMVKQLSSFRSEQLQSSILIILRHIIEDDEVVRQIMKSEMTSAFESNRRNLDTTTYLRNFAHLVLRNPEIFVQVTNELMMIPRYDETSGTQQIVLKPTPPTPKADADKQDPQAEPSVVTKPSLPTSTPSKPILERVKTSDLRMPVVENPDGVVHHLISELLSYKDVDDHRDMAKPAKSIFAEVSADTTMTGSDAPEAEVPSVPVADTKDADSEFKNEDHPIYIYKCFLLQCLTELLSSYNRAKHEFINYKRKTDIQSSTPSKPRSYVLNYLLYSLIPVGFITHASDIREKKLSSISNWAIQVVTALCSKTFEVGYVKPPSNPLEYQEEPDLLFVQRFVLEHALRAFKEAHANSEPLAMKYSRLLNLSELFTRLLSGRMSPGATSSNQVVDAQQRAIQQSLAKTMFEKNFIASLTASIADIDLNFPDAKRTVKYILGPLKNLTRTAIDLSIHSDVPLRPGEEDDDDISSASSSASEMDNVREETPDLFRNSALGILDPRRNNDEESVSSGSSDDDDDEGIDYEEYGDEMEYEEEEQRDLDEVISDDDDEIEGMGPIEGLSGDVAMDLEIDDMMEGDEDDDDDEEGSEMDDDLEEDSDDDDEDDMELEEVDADQIVYPGEDEDWGTDPDEDGEEGEEFDDGADDGDDAYQTIIGGGNMSDLVEVIDVNQAGRFGGRNRIDESGAMISDTGNDPELENDSENFLGEDMDEEDPDEYEEDVIYEPDLEDEDENDDFQHMTMGWDGLGSHINPHRHAQIRGQSLSPWGLFAMPARHDLAAGVLPRSRTNGPPRNMDDGTNPLLHRPRGTNDRPAVPHHDPSAAEWMTAGFEPMGFPGGARGATGSMISNLLNMISSSPVPPTGPIQVTLGAPPGAGNLDAIIRAIGARPHRTHDYSSRSTRLDPASAVQFMPAPTFMRWGEEARLLFGSEVATISVRVANAILSQLIPPARREQKRLDDEAAEAKRKADEEAAERRAKDEAEAEVKKAKAKEEAEQAAREQAAKQAEEAAQAAQAGPSTEEAGDESSDSVPAPIDESSAQMEGVEATETPAAEPTERTIIRLRGRDVDITHLGIDMAYMEELPEEWREEVILQQLAEHRAANQSSRQSASQAAATSELDAIAGIPADFLDALPPEMRREFQEAEAAQQRQRERENARRQAQEAGAVAMPEETDSATFFATLDPALRQQLLMDADDETLATLPADLAAEARALSGDRRLRHLTERVRRTQDRPGEHVGEVAVRKPGPVMQILDKAGVATLMRLMFVPQHSAMKHSLHGILKDICTNKQNRAEVVSLLLLILQDGSSDMTAVEKSFTHLSLRAKQPNIPKTPQGKVAGVDSIRGSSETSPLVVVQQCLNALSHLVQQNKSIGDFFLREHEMSTNLKSRASRKGKAKELKSNKYPINALLNLLDHKLVVDSSTVMEQLASLLSIITYPLLALQKNRKREEEAAKAESAAAAESSTSAGAEGGSAQSGNAVDPALSENTDQPTQAQDQVSTVDAGAAKSIDPTVTTEESAEDGNKKKTRTDAPPEVPEQNLRFVVSIIAARECSSKTFKDTLSLMTHLSTIPKSKGVFGLELRNRAQELGQNILKDLSDLSQQVDEPNSESRVQSLAASRFAPASSDQAKLLRVITALDYLFDPKRSQDHATEGAEDRSKEDILTSLYENDVFGPLWVQLGEILTIVGKRGNLLSIATILLPLIEVLMVVCKNTTLKDNSLAAVKEITLNSPPPESRIEHIFYKFTEDHRKILNDLVRHNPKLMSGSFSLLVKNSKVLEFDNKRNFFHRRLHSRGSELRQPHASLQLSVRREMVFLDSYKALYYKKPDEFKFGKLNIRFVGEEGVDAGGVTREWFQVLAKQMFDPNYALFNPVASDRTTFHPNSLSGINAEHLNFFKFVGRIIGKALYENRVLDCHFSRAVYKRILGKTVSIKDMETLDLDYYKSLVWMLENDITDIITETFSVETDEFGEVKIVDLIENGRNIPVTEENKQEYVQLVVKHKMIGSVEAQLEHFLIGFHDIVPAELIAIFNEQELELLISGLPDIDVDDWKNNTDYHNYQAASPQIQWFWRAVRSFDKEERAKLLQFITGTSKVPLNGFKELEGMNGFTRFNIHRDYGSKERLPSSHTCFNQLDLPEYEGYEQLRKALYTAITQGSEGFGFA